MKTNDWVKEVVLKISELVDIDPHNIGEIEDLIEKHCPFKKDTAYIEVGTLLTMLEKLDRTLEEMKGDIRYLRSQR